jgi:lipopolysaccharide transport system ATP-binding protein
LKPILEIKDVSKRFLIQSNPQPYLSLRETVYSLLRPSSKKEIFWALQDVSFNVMQGDTIGIIGKNGAGKSTLLKILSKITPPSRGSIIARGRIASLLEVGTGFHPELSGRENIYLNGSILGMRRHEIQKKFDAIVDFSGVEKFIDTPLKHYSSGMQLRLAFAVAAFLENEILIVDEVLAVGDSEFQKKCIGKMEDITQTGRTILFVSHDLTAISNLTKKAVFLKQGRVHSIGTTGEVIEQYLADGSTIEKSYRKEINPVQTHPQISGVEITTSLPNNVHEHGKTLSIKVNCFTREVPKDPTWVSIHITDTKGRGVLHVTNGGDDLSICEKEGHSSFVCTFPETKLYMGRYLVNIYLSGPPNAAIYERLSEIISFDVVMNGSNHEFGWIPDACSYIENSEWTNTYA